MNYDVLGALSSSPHCLGNGDFVSIWTPAGAPELVKRMGVFVKSLVSAVKPL
ncbi:MAG: hypothetical protein ABSC89_04800 [Verrucomicrobiota bacterium]